MFLVFSLLISYCYAEEKTAEELIRENEDLKRELLELRKQVLESRTTASSVQTTMPSQPPSEREDTESVKSLPGKDAFADEYNITDQRFKKPKPHNPEYDSGSSSQRLIFRGEIVQNTVLQDKPIQNEGKDKNQDEVKSEDQDHDETKDENKPENEDKEGCVNKGEDKKEEREGEGKSRNNEEFVITPTRTKQLLKNTGSSVSVITSEDIKNSKAPMLLDVLRRAPGLEVARTGGIGGTTGMFIRGASSAQTLVFVDGVQMNSSTTGAYDFANLTTDNIERVEILRGPQSTLYGSEAIGGVVSIFTKKGAGDTAVTVGTEYGMRDTYRENVHISGGKEKFDYALGASYLKTHGISSASNGDEADGYENFTGSTRVGWNFMDDGRVDATMRAAHSDLEYDAFQFGVGPVDDSDRRLTTDEVLFSTKIKKTFFDIWTPSFLISVNDTELKGFDPTDASGEFRIPTRTWRLEHQSDFTLFDIDTITLGYEYEVREGENVGNFDKRFWNNSVFFQNQLELFESFNWTAGFRYDDYSTFGNNLTYRTTVSYGIEEIGTRFHGSWGTGFRAPSLNELFFPFFGNPNLNPEESKGWDFGIEKEIIKEKLTIDVTYFENDFTNLITAAVQPDGSFLAENVARAESEGVEATVTYRPLTKLSLTGTYTYTGTTDKGKDQQLPRRPRNRATLGIHTQPLERLNINVTGVIVRDRIDSDGSEMDNYWTVDQATRYDITRLMTAYIRFENLFDYDYEEVTGFSSFGFTAYGGLEFKF
ncbi:MAG: Outer membrane vitamin B12 receptor BtuB [Candidatus Jettenia ecosi]|uniref:Outer membrane vitamin B12 receptor BtuB n=1 Tax=Candidatus Jettenia ecosi TaxID=2494326 RepID=A0A533QBR8_9BACT|nr:MAG: Outer membrane vitamin B12 receptor BtuB [Candidatus Jettenia ecosi]